MSSFSQTASLGMQKRNYFATKKSSFPFPWHGILRLAPRIKHTWFFLFCRGMPAAFRELFESFMNVCISLLILSLFAWQALASLRESLGGGPVRKGAYQGSQQIFAAVSRCDMYVTIIVSTYMEPNWQLFCLGWRLFFSKGSNLIVIAFDNWLPGI